MIERPILFADNMVQALKAGRKTQSRRPITKLIGFGDVTNFGPSNTPGYDWHFRFRSCWNDITNDQLLKACPYFASRLYVREAWTPDHAAFYPHHPNVYRADGYDPRDDDGTTSTVYSPEQNATFPFKWRPSIHMPRSASRITLVTLNVEAVKLWPISEDDAQAEGVDDLPNPDFDPDDADDLAGDDEGEQPYTFAAGFYHTWRDLYGVGSWDANPWVWKLSFSPIVDRSK